RIVVPFVNPNAPETEVFENEQAIRDFQRLQTHRSVSHSVDPGARQFARRSALSPPTAFNPRRIGGPPIASSTSRRICSLSTRTTSPPSARSSPINSERRTTFTVL